MARNRKNQSAGVQFGPALKASALCVFIVVCCVGYVWQKRQIAELAHQIRAGEKNLATMRENNEKLRRQLAGLMTPSALEARARDLKLGLGPAQPHQIWRLAEPLSEPIQPVSERQLASQGTLTPELP